MPPKSKPSSSHSSRPASRSRSSSSHRSSSFGRSSLSHRSSSIFGSSSSKRSSSSRHTSSGYSLTGTLFSNSSRSSTADRSSSSSGRSSVSTNATNIYVEPNTYTPNPPIVVTCDYCGSANTIEPYEEKTCHHCGASLPSYNRSASNIAIDTVSSVNTSSTTDDYSVSKSYLLKLTTACLVGFIPLLIVLFVVFNLSANNGVSSQPSANTYEKVAEQNYVDNSTNTGHQSVYVEALERSVPWNAEYETYYDENTDCYFFKNYDLEPPIWQYWFEGVSTPYDEYGWMEYDFDENCWYIQTNAETWEKYTGSTDGLWHMNENE